LQGRLARDLGVSQQSLSGYERGVSRVPDDVAARLAKLWGYSEVEVRRHLGLYVPGAERGDPIAPFPEWPDNALRLPRGIKISDLDPRDAKLLESIVDAFIENIRQEGR
jgi:transcriptional regulator with XRE-family HTH domain